jgi:hypothetical protein
MFLKTFFSQVYKRFFAKDKRNKTSKANKNNKATKKNGHAKG